MEAAVETVHRPGLPRSERDAAILERFNKWMQLPIVVSAVLPLVIVPESAALQALAAEVSALRRQVEALTARLTGTPPGLIPQEPGAGDDTLG